MAFFFFFSLTTGQLVAPGDLSGLQVFGFQAGLYNHANGHQADRQPANGGCTPQPDQPDLTRCDITIPEIITIKAKHLEKEHRQTSTTDLWSVFANMVWSSIQLLKSIYNCSLKKHYPLHSGLFRCQFGMMWSCNAIGS